MARLLGTAREALGAGELATALRNLDRAWRFLPEGTAILAPIYARLLALEGSDPYATLGLLQRANDSAPDPEIAALSCLTLIRLERFEDASRHLDQALKEYCVVPGGLLFEAAVAVTDHGAANAAGWVGHGPKLELIGQFSPNDPSSTLQIQVNAQPAFTQLLRTFVREGRCTFSVPLPPSSLHARLEVSSRGVALLGSNSRIPSDFGLDGRSATSGNQVTGWARVGWLPMRAPRIRIESERGTHRMAKTGTLPLPMGRWPFWMNLRKVGLRGTHLRITAELPDGKWQSLPDSPLILERGLRGRGSPSYRLTKWRQSVSRPPRGHTRVVPAECTDVVIPVYRGLEESLACIYSVLQTLTPNAQVVVVDDATDSIELASSLDGLAAAGRITLLRNTENLGFVASVNRGLELNPENDAVILNSDTRVFGDWLERLRATAYGERRVGTVTPLTNNGSIASYPKVAGTTVTPVFSAALHTLVTLTHPGVSVEIPVGVGFCLYMRRDCLRDVGLFDRALFEKGYGEETDFCIRARRRGWSHRLAADVYVYHAEGVSFGERRRALLERGNRVMNLRYPGYDGFIASFASQDPLRELRCRLDEHRLSSFQGRFVLIVSLAMTGGVERFVTERCSSIRAQGFFPLVLKPAAVRDRRHCTLWTDALEVPNLRYDVPRDLSRILSLLRALRIEAVEIQHFLHLDAALIDGVRALPIPYDVFIHDYSWICPRVTLIDGSGRYCGEPAVSVCQKCVRRNGSLIGEAISVPALRSRSAAWLRGARHVFAPSEDTARRLERHISGLQVQARPHTPGTDSAPMLPREAKRKLVRVALLGAIGDHKGYQVLLSCALNARARKLPLEFVIVGYTANDGPLLKTGKVFITGRYTDAEAPHLLRREDPDVAWLPSVWPETWCYALDYALAAGLPVLAFDLGAIAERVRAAGAGKLIPLELKPGQINDALLDLVRPATQKSRSVQSPASKRDIDANIVHVVSQNKTMNKTPTGKTTAQETREDALSASLQILPLPAGLYLFSVKAAGKAPQRVNGQLALPAVHVGLGPGVRPEDVEFVEGPNTNGAWLFAQGDLLVTKVKGQGATLVMTSVRGPGGDVLSIKVEKLEGRADAPSVADAPAKARSEDSAAHVARPLDDQILPVHVSAHVRARGDMTFADVPWAGRVAPGLWIESYSVRPLHRLKPADIEYKGLTGSGFETPWLTDEKMCGTKGMAVPLVGFAVRLKPSAATADYDCEYSGYFQSGATVGPLRNGAPCRSTVANDPLEGMQIRLLKRAFATSQTQPEVDAHAAEDGSEADAAGKGRRQPARQPQGPARRPARRP